MINNKKKKKKKEKGTCRRVYIAVSVVHRVKIKEKEKERQVLGPCSGTKKAMENEGDGDANCKWRTWNVPQRLGKGDWKSWKSEDELRPSNIVKIS